MALFFTHRTAIDVDKDQRTLTPLIKQVIDNKHLSIKDATLKFGVR